MSAKDIRHDLFVYDSDDTFVAQMLRYVMAGLDADELVMVTVTSRKQAILRAALGPDAQRLTYADPAELYARPEAALARYDAAARARGDEFRGGMRVYGELPLCETEAEWDRWMVYESIVNRVFEGRGATLMCGYDARAVPPAVLRQARQTHPVVLDDAWQISTEYEEPERFVARLTPPFEPLSGLRSLDVREAETLQERLAGALSIASVSENRASDLLVAAREVLTNATRYGNGVRALRIGRVDDHIVCEVSDAGPGLDDPLAGWIPPRPFGDERAGLWIARQLTSRLELHHEPEGLTVRLWG